MSWAILALHDDLLVGTGSLMPETARVGRIARMHTASAHRRHGIGTMILKELEHRARERGFDELVLETNVDWDDVIAFYSSNGYDEIGRNDASVRFGKAI